MYCKIINNEITGGCASKVNTTVLCLRITDDHDDPYWHFHTIVLNKKAELEFETSQLDQIFFRNKAKGHYKTCLMQVCECKSS